MLKSVCLFYIDICFSSSINEGHSIDTQFRTHDLMKEDDCSDHSCKKKKSFLHHMHHFVLASHASICFYIVCISSFIVYHKNDLEILTIATMFLVRVTIRHTLFNLFVKGCIRIQTLIIHTYFLESSGLYK